jgi:DNA invertase Pin-like site-specific DNA recombinase
VAKLDRLARALGVQETVLAVAWRAGAKVFSADTGEILQDDPSDPMRTLLRQVVGAVAEFERALIAKRLRDGRAAKAAAGKHAVGEYAFGTRGAGEGRDRDAAPDEAEQMTVARIVELRNSGASLRAIVARLDSEGLKPRRAAHWSPQSVQAVCLREGLAPGAAPVVSADQAEEARRHGRLGPLPD